MADNYPTRTPAELLRRILELKEHL
jgi:hypothetical protein